MEAEQIKENLREALVPENRKRELLQPLTSGIITGLTIFVPSLAFGTYGFPLGFYSPAMASCMALNCPSPQPAQLNPLTIILNFLIWYIVIGLIYTGYRRWSE